MTTADLPRIGPHQLPGRIVLAPMAGLTDQPFRNICRRLGAGMATSEMTTADTSQWQTGKSRHRLTFDNENGLKIVQIAGSEPEQFAEAAQAIAELGADIIDINMGCPAKKVCKRLAGSALLQDESLVKDILQATVGAVDIPVTLKMRTGWNPENRNGPAVAALAEECGIASLAVHGRTRTCMYKGEAEYDTIRSIKEAVSIPVFANGDITTAQQAEQVLKYTTADGILIGRGALGYPWIFREVNSWLAKKVSVDAPSAAEQRDIILSHLDALYELYGEATGVRVARKHLTWYCQHIEGAGVFRDKVVRIESAAKQRQATEEFFIRYQANDLTAAKASTRSSNLLRNGLSGKQQEKGDKKEEERRQGS